MKVDFSSDGASLPVAEQQQPPSRPWTLRRCVLWLHLAIGLSAGLVVWIMSVTGVLLTYERQLVALAEGELRVAVPSQATRLSLESLLSRAREVRPEAGASAITWSSDPAAPVTIALGRENTLRLDPYTGQEVGPGAQGLRAFFREVTEWHRWLGLHGAARDTARAITGASNLGFLVLVVSGFYLWWPRRWRPSVVASLTLFRSGLSGKARDFNWHNVLGFWFNLPLAVIVAGGVTISYPWANDLLYKLTGTPVPTRGGPGGPAAPGGRQGGGAREARPVDWSGLDAGAPNAEARMPGWSGITVRAPNGSDAPLAFAIQQGYGTRPGQRATLTLDRRTAEVVKWEPYESLSAGRRWALWMRFLHTGEALGLAGQTVAGLASLAACVLVYTGLALTWRRFWAWRARAR